MHSENWRHNLCLQSELLFKENLVHFSPPAWRTKAGEANRMQRTNSACSSKMGLTWNWKLALYCNIEWRISLLYFIIQHILTRETDWVPCKASIGLTWNLQVIEEPLGHLIDHSVKPWIINYKWAWKRDFSIQILYLWILFLFICESTPCCT